MAVLSLTAVGLTAFAATPAAAAGAPERNFSVYASAKPVFTQAHDANGGYLDYSYGAYTYGSASHFDYSPDGGVTTYQQQSAHVLGQTVVSSLTMEPGSNAEATDSAPYGDSNGVSATGTPGFSEDGGVLHVGASTSTADANMPADGTCVPVGDRLFEATSAVQSFDRAPVNYSDGSEGLDPVNVVGEVSGSIEATMFAVDGSSTLRGVESTAQGSTGTYHALNYNVEIEVLQPATVTVSTDGTTGATDVTGATVRVTYRGSLVGTYTDADGPVNLSFTDPAHRALRFQLSINEASESADATTASANTMAFSGTYSRTDEDTLAVHNVGYLVGGQVNATVTVPTGGVFCGPQADTDTDGLSDYEEQVRYSTDPNNPDTDGDGLTDGDEVNEHSTSPTAIDSDGDSLGDGAEVNVHGSNPAAYDTDGDTINDGVEVNDTETDPADADSDDDGIDDSTEVYSTETDPNDPDSDNDGLTDGAEGNDTQTDPNDADSDDGGVNDGDEVSAGTDPNNGNDDNDLNDLDSDGLTGAEELANGTNPTNPDTDGDGLTDGAEVNTHNTDPTVADADNDGLDDGDEIANNTNPQVADTDGDRLSDGAEVNTHGTDPNDTDTDNDGLDDDAEVNAHGTNPVLADTDNDNLNDGAEVNTHHTNPKAADTDGDTLDDGREVNQTNTNPRAPDTDTDGLTDGAEVNDTNTDPNVADTDNDGLVDGAEVNQHHTDPQVADTDGGSVNDGAEVARGTDPLDASDDAPVPANKDFDNDGLNNNREARLGTDPRDKDTDNDNLRDYREVVKTDTNPLAKDTDRDNLRDGNEVKGYTNTKFDKTFKSNPLKVDSDRDGLRDRVEVTGSRNDKFRNEPTSPNRADTDGGGVHDLREIQRGSNPADLGSGPRNP